MTPASDLNQLQTCRIPYRSSKLIMINSLGQLLVLQCEEYEKPYCWARLCAASTIIRYFLFNNNCCPSTIFQCLSSSRMASEIRQECKIFKEPQMHRGYSEVHDIRYRSSHSCFLEQLQHEGHAPQSACTIDTSFLQVQHCIIAARLLSLSAKTEVMSQEYIPDIFGRNTNLQGVEKSGTVESRGR